MKRLIQLTLASLTILVGVVFASLPAVPVSAIDVFKDACDATGTEGTDATDADGTTDATDTTGTTGTNPETGGAAGTDATASDASGGDSSTLCGATKTDDAPDIIKNIINTILFVLGMIAVIMIVIGGIRYTTSNGDASSVKGAKDTVLYAVVGLVVAIMAYAIVNFVLDRLGGQ